MLAALHKRFARGTTFCLKTSKMLTGLTIFAMRKRGKKHAAPVSSGHYTALRAALRGIVRFLEVAAIVRSMYKTSNMVIRPSLLYRSPANTAHSLPMLIIGTAPQIVKLCSANEAGKCCDNAFVRATALGRPRMMHSIPFHLITQQKNIYQ